MISSASVSSSSQRVRIFPVVPVPPVISTLFPLRLAGRFLAELLLDTESGEFESDKGIRLSGPKGQSGQCDRMLAGKQQIRAIDQGRGESWLRSVSWGVSQLRFTFPLTIGKQDGPILDCTRSGVTDTDLRLIQEASATWPRIKIPNTCGSSARRQVI